MVDRCAHYHGVCGPRCIEPAGHPGPHLYRCAGASCPGLPWAASAMPHPSSCTLGVEPVVKEDSDGWTELVMRAGGSINPRYLRYADMQNRSPVEQLAHDEAAWPGGRMTGFVLWIRANLQAFRAQSPEHFMGSRGPLVDQDAFDRFLTTTTIQPERP